MKTSKTALKANEAVLFGFLEELSPVSITPEIDFKRKITQQFGPKIGKHSFESSLTPYSESVSMLVYRIREKFTDATYAETKDEQFEFGRLYDRLEALNTYIEDYLETNESFTDLADGLGEYIGVKRSILRKIIHSMFPESEGEL